MLPSALRHVRTALVAAAVLGCAQALPAATWLLPVRRLVPALEGRGAPGHVALTIDDGPHPDSTPALLDLLAGHGVRATFFVLGERARRHPELIDEMHCQGHELAVHGWSHVNYLRLGPAAAAHQVERSARLLEDITGRRPQWFRPPYGVLSASAVWASRRAGLRPVLWTAWAHDWAAPAPGAIVDALRDGGGPGGTVLLHDAAWGGAPGSDESCRAALGVLLDDWAGHGLQAGPLGEHGATRCGCRCPRGRRPSACSGTRPMSA